MALSRIHRTTDAVKDLISIASGGETSIDDVSTFDTLPYSPEGQDEEELVLKAESTFTEMVKAKEPDVILCCYQGNSDNEFIQSLRSLGIGRVFDEPALKISINCNAMRVNAFHPSYAVNYHPTYSCFRRLLLLEFVQSFSILSGKWEEERWMQDLRLQCRHLARQLSEESKIKRHEAAIKRWEDILISVHQSLSSMNYCKPDVTSVKVQVGLIDSNLSWNCADASLLLDQVESGSRSEIFAKMLLRYFKSWCERACDLSKLHKNLKENDLRGYFELKYLSESPDISDHSIHELRDIFFTFLKDINLSFFRKGGDNLNVHYDILAQRHAFQRFSGNLEKAAGRSSKLSLSAKFQDMRLGNQE